MKNKLVLFCVSVIISAACSNSMAQAPKNLNLLSSLSFAPQSLAGVWHYEAAGKSYALLGASEGIIVVDVTIPTTPLVILQVPGINNLWKEIKVEGNYAYVTTEGLDPTTVLNGIQIINLSYLPDSAPSKIYKGDGLILNQLESGHSITSSGEYIYINGHNIQSLNRGVLICNIVDPWNPVYVGAVTNNYCHDSYVRGDTIWTSDILAGIFSVYNITDRANPILLATQQTPGNFNHNAWLSDDGQTLFTTDERSNEPLGAFDVSDLSNITLLDTYYATNFSTSEVHNVRVKNDFLINPSYGSQLTLVDASRPANMVEVGNYTTGNYLLWDADPYLSSGIIIATETTPGTFYIFEPEYLRACYLEGLITDSITGIPIPAATIQIVSAGIIKNSKSNGDYKTGTADPGTFDILFTKSGYAAKTITGINLSRGVVTNLNVVLRPLGANIDSDVFSEAVNVYPIPFSDELKIENGYYNIKEVILYNLLGEKVGDWIFDNFASTQTIPTKGLAKGAYLLEIKTSSHQAFKKVLKD